LEKTNGYTSDYFEGTQPYAISVGGLYLVIVRDPEDIATVWKDTKALTFDKFIQSAFRGIGVPSTSYAIMFQEDPASFVVSKDRPAPLFACENPSKKRYIDLQEDWIKEQLQPGERMRTVQKLFLGYIDKGLHWNNFTSKFVLSANAENHTISLYNFCRYTLVDAGTKTFLGEEIFHLDPDFVQHYIEWENTSWKVAFQHPGIFSKDMHKTRKNLVDVIARYYSLQPCQRPGLSWLFDRMQSEQRKLGLKLNETAAISLIMLWGYVENTSPPGISLLVVCSRLMDQ